MNTIKSDVIVIGGGIVGSSATLFMSQKGLKVTLIERDACGSRSSGVNFGGVRCQGRPITHLPLAIRARDIWRDAENIIGGRFEYTVTGHLKIARNEDELKILNDYYAESQGMGLDLQMLSGDEIRRRYPWFSGLVLGGSLSPYDGQANPRIVSPAFAAAARKAGARVCEREPVQTVEKLTTGYRVTTPKGIYEAEQLLVTAGAWSNNIASQLEEPFPLTHGFPAMAVTEPVPYFLHPCLGVQGGDIYIRQVTRGNVVFGGGTGVAVSDSSSRATSKNIMDLMARLLELIPSMGNTQILRTWSGMEGFLPGKTPVIDKSLKHSGLYYGFGFSGGGFEIGPGAGAALADLVANGNTPTDLTPFSMSRFA